MTPCLLAIAMYSCEVSKSTYFTTRLTICRYKSLIVMTSSKKVFGISAFWCLVQGLT